MIQALSPGTLPLQLDGLMDRERDSNVQRRIFDSDRDHHFAAEPIRATLCHTYWTTVIYSHRTQVPMALLSYYYYIGTNNRKKICIML